MAEALTTRPSFNELLQKKWDEGKFVCVGLDPDLTHKNFPPDIKNRYHSSYRVLMDFIPPIIDATADLVCAFKPNFAFYANDQSLNALEDIVHKIHEDYPDILVIGDLKRADIGNTNRGYADEAFRRYRFDAVTTNPYFGGDTFGPFTSHEGKGLVILCKTSNSGSKELQDMPIDCTKLNLDGLLTREEIYELFHLLEPGHNLRVYEMVAFLAAKRWNKSGNLALVVGATHPEAFAPVRRLAGDIPFLIPGIGTQGGDLEKTLKYAPDSKGQGMIINSSSGIIFASSGEDFAEAARRKTLELHRQISQFRSI